MNVKLVAITPDAEKIMGYCARVSNPSNQDNHETAPKLLAYCIKHQHWSVFEMANLILEIETGRDIAPQILRHRSFNFQEFSQRYAEANMGYQERQARSQDKKNRQASNDDLPETTKDWFKKVQNVLHKRSNEYYQEALTLGIAKECARALLPLNTTTKLYMNGTVRSWITYFLVRMDKATQLEHREVATACYKVFREQLPNIAKTLEEVYPEIFVGV